MRPLTALLPVTLTLALAACTPASPTAAGSSAPAAPAGETLPPSLSPSGEIQPTFPALTGDVTTSTRLLKYDASHRAAIVEPMVFAPARDYCPQMHVDPLDSRCAQELITVNSNTRVTVPVRDDVDLRGMGDGSSDCLGDMDSGTTCKASAAYMRTLADNKAAVVITLRDGSISRIAELYQP